MIIRLYETLFPGEKFSFQKPLLERSLIDIQIKHNFCANLSISDHICFIQVFRTSNKEKDLNGLKKFDVNFQMDLKLMI